MLFDETIAVTAFRVIPVFVDQNIRHANNITNVKVCESDCDSVTFSFIPVTETEQQVCIKFGRYGPEVTLD